jgi:hypothetical protein
MKVILFPMALLLVLCVFSCSEKTTQAFADTVSSPTFSLASGMYYPQQTVSINCSTPGVTVRYTIDGTAPDTHSTLYAAPLEIDSTTTVKAIAYRKGWNQSAIATADYEIYQWTVGPGLMLNITNMIATPDTIYADGGITSSIISVKVKNAEQFGAPGQLVTFQTSLGNILPEDTTDENGNASTTLRGEDISGVALVKAIIRVYHPNYPEFLIGADTVSINVNILEVPPAPTIVNSLQFTQAGQIDLNVANTGGTEAAILKVKLYDINGSLVNLAQNVWFKIINSSPPLGANLNNQPQGDSVLAVSENGIAQITVYSGTAPGSLNIRASCTSGGRYVQALKSNIFIYTGPPHRIEIFSSGFNTGIDMSGGLWRIIVGAQVYDIYDNPMGYGTGVWFYLPDDIYNCQIAANAYTGNESANGDSLAGTAYTTLIYSGSYTFENLTIRALTGGINGVEVFEETDIVLPLNQPQIEIEAIPGHLIFHGNTNPVPASATASLNVSVFDIQGCPIHNARISLTADHGVFEYIAGTNEDPLNCNLPQTPSIIVTDWYDAYAQGYADVNDGQDGFAQGSIRFYAWEIPLGDPQTGTPGSTTATITGRILGTNTLATNSIALIRYDT